MEREGGGAEQDKIKKNNREWYREKTIDTMNAGVSPEC